MKFFQSGHPLRAESWEMETSLFYQLWAPRLFQLPFNHVAFGDTLRDGFQGMAEQLPLQNFCDGGRPVKALVVKMDVESGRNGERADGFLIYQFEEHIAGQFLNHFKRAYIFFSYHLATGMLSVRCAENGDEME